MILPSVGMAPHYIRKERIKKRAVGLTTGAVNAGAITIGNFHCWRSDNGSRARYTGSKLGSAEKTRELSEHKKLNVNARVEDIVYDGLNLESLPDSDPFKNYFGSDGNIKSKTWKRILGCEALAQSRKHSHGCAPGNQR